MPATGPVSRKERRLLLDLQTRALRYFLDNQSPCHGLIRDRQTNLGPPREGTSYSIAATGMGLIALALASGEPYRLLSRQEVVTRIERTLLACLNDLPQTCGILPHFVHAGGKPLGFDVRSTVDSGWLLAGALWSAHYLADPGLCALASRLWHRVDWRYWTADRGLLSHGADRRGRKLACTWDRCNGETAFLYVLAAGAEERMAWPVAGWTSLGAFASDAGGKHFPSADLGLFVFQYGLDLLDLDSWPLPGPVDLAQTAWIAPRANARVCADLSERYQTYRSFWGLSAGDGPGTRGERDTYRPYAPSGPTDGTAHLTASVASVQQAPALVWENICRALARGGLLGAYGLASVNLDQCWVGQDMVGIDAGALVLALDNVLAADRVRRVFHALEPVQRGLARLRSVQQMRLHAA